MIGLGRDLFGREVGFIADGHFGGLGHHQMRFDLQLPQRLQQPDAIGHARCAADSPITSRSAVLFADCSRSITLVYIPAA